MTELTDIIETIIASELYDRDGKLLPKPDPRRIAVHVLNTMPTQVRNAPGQDQWLRDVREACDNPDGVMLGPPLLSRLLDGLIAARFEIATYRDIIATISPITDAARDARDADANEDSAKWVAAMSDLDAALKAHDAARRDEQQ